MLVTGGNGTSGTAHLFDPATRTFSPLTMAQPHDGGTATLFGDGRVLIAGGAPVTTAVELLEGTTVFATVTAMGIGPSPHAALDLTHVAAGGSG